MTYTEHDSDMQHLQEFFQSGKMDEDEVWDALKNMGYTDEQCDDILEEWSW